MEKQYSFEIERRFTDTYKKYINADISVREIKCLEQMYPMILCDIRPGDLFAGRIKMSLAGFSPEPGGFGYYCNEEEIKKLLSKGGYTDDLKNEINSMIDFWKTENTSFKVRSAFSPELSKALPEDDWIKEPLAAAPLYRMAGAYPDYEKLLNNGICGLVNIVKQRKQKALSLGENTSFFDSMEASLELLQKCCMHYYDNAIRLSGSVSSPDEKANLLETACSLKRIADSKPETMRDAMQLMWLYTLVCGSYNYGRMDIYLADFLENDLNNKCITKEYAQDLFGGLWRLMAERRTIWNGRVVIGGKGRKNEKYADMIAMFAMEASKMNADTEPQLTLRFYDGMNPKLMNKALEVIGAGCTYPMLYNDDVNIPSVSNAFNIDIKEAEQYVPFGCGEYVIDHKSFGSPNGIINLLKVLELALHNGTDAVTGKEAGPKTGEFKNFETFDMLLDAYKKQTEYFVAALAKHQKIEYDITGKTAPFLYLSLLYDDCIERGKGLFSGGVKYLGGTVETYGNINTADSLTAIKEVVYDKKIIGRGELIRMLDADFAGYEKERLLLSNTAKYGNDIDEADNMAKMVHEHICGLVKSKAESVGLHSYLAVIINNSANTTMGRNTAASADGRKKGVYMANANNPWSGNDKNGLTAMLNSLVKLRADIHAGAVQNMKFSPELFKSEAAAQILKGYFQSGGAQAMISVVNKNDLEQALITPEKYSNLFVRVGGFSAKYIELEKDVQLEILNRTLY